MKNLYLIETNASIMVVCYDTEDRTATVLDTAETNTKGFNLSMVEDVSAGIIYNDIEDIVDWAGIDYSNSETPRIIETIENWR